MSNTYRPLIDDPARNTIFERELARASHGAQARFWELMAHGGYDGDALALLNQAVKRPTRFTSPDAALWSDKEISDILRNATEVDKVRGRALGHREIMFLEQREMIRKALLAR